MTGKFRAVTCSDISTLNAVLAGIGARDDLKSVVYDSRDDVYVVVYFKWGEE
jgi:hypothetical protein